MINKLTSVKKLIAKVFTDLDLKEGDHRVSDMVEYAGEALLKIGAFPSFTHKVTGKDGVPFLEIVDYQAKLPSDFHSMLQASFSESATGAFYPMTYGTGSFEFNKEQNTTSTLSEAYPESSYINLIMTLFTLDYDDALARLNSDPGLRDNLTVMLNRMYPSNGISESICNPNGCVDYKYILQGNYIRTNVRTGFIMAAYQAIPTDADGYPLIPDDVDFMEALYWYITMKLMYPEWKAGRIRDEVYYDARRSWNFNCKKAYGHAMMPNVDQLESIKNQWLRLVPEIHEHANSFSSLGDRQMVYNKNR